MPRAFGVLTVTISALLLSVTARGDAPRALAVTPWCGRTADRVGFHLAFANGARRTVVNLSCSMNSGECTGAQLDLGAVDRGAPLTALALNPITGARLDPSRGPDGSLRIGWGTRAFLFARDLGSVAFDGTHALCGR